MPLDPSQLPTLDDVRREIYRRDFYAFVRDFWHIVEPAEALVDTRLMRLQCAVAQRFVEALVADLLGEPWARGYMQDLGVEVPPGSSKSLIWTVFLPAFSWGPLRAPWLRWLFSTYAQELTLRDARRRRDLILSSAFQGLWPLSFKSDTNQQAFYENERRGWCLSTSVGGQGTGHRPHVFIGDDLLNAIDAHSTPAQEQVREHLRAMATRGVRPSVYRRAVIGQRLCEQDPGAYAREHKFEILSLPMQYDPARHCVLRDFADWRTQPGELLVPERVSLADVERLRMTLGPYAAEAQLQQDPQPVGGGILKAGWFIDRMPPPRDEWLTVIQAWDTGLTRKEGNSASGNVTLVISKRGVDIAHCAEYHLEMPELEEQIAAAAKEHRARLVLIENKANGPSLMQRLNRRSDLPAAIEGAPAELDKDSREHAAAPFVARGCVGMDLSQPWAQLLIKRLPSKTKRDLKDALVHALLYADKHFNFDATAGYAYESLGSRTSDNARKPVHAPSSAPGSLDDDDGRDSDSGTF